ncbi:MAG: PHP domain-containing protein [Gemmatimonadota bacterium]|nr:PHP domain-containing protein [Gemmatimonadota bacterium]
MNNAQLAAALTELADYMALEGRDTHRVAHYKGAATALRRFEHPVADMIRGGVDLTGVPGIGKGLAGFLEELIRSGTAQRLDDHRARIPEGLLEVVRVEGVGATRARTLWRDMGIETVADLESVLGSRGVLALDGFGPGVVARIRRGLAAMAQLRGRVLLTDADRTLAEVDSVLSTGGAAFAVAGETARRTETVALLDVVAAGDPGQVWDLLAGSPFEAAGPRESNPVSVSSPTGLPIRITTVDEAQLGAVSHHLTGPPAYLEALSDEAAGQGLTLTPLGLIHGDGLRITDVTEIYEALDLPPVPPELRVDSGTIQRVRSRGVPGLVAHDDVRGDLHLHTTWSDGAATLERMVQAARERGYEYVAITDHSPSTGAVSGLDARALGNQRQEIARVQDEYPDIRVFTGIEVDILPDGSLDMDDESLMSLDVVVASVHSAFEQDRATMTRRIIRAMENPAVRILGHPTGRKIGRRLGYPVDVDAILDAALALDVAVEVNGSPRRLDLDWQGLWQCMERGVNVVVTSDAHSIARLDNIQNAVDQARRGWLSAQNVVNTRSLSEIMSWTNRRRG